MTWSNNRISRRAVMRGAAGATIAAPFISGVPASAASVPNIRYATGGGIGPNEMETIIFLDYVKQNVLKNYGKAYTLDMTFTRGTPEAAALLAAGQADVATLSGPAFATIIVKDAVPNGLTVEYMPWSSRLFREVPQPVNGELTVPEKPGLGLEFDADSFKRYGV